MQRHHGPAGFLHAETRSRGRLDAGVPLLVLAAARSERREARSSLAIPGGFVADVVTIAGLEAGAATGLAASVIGAADELPAALAGCVLATSEGNPLFVGQLVRMRVHDGILEREWGSLDSGRGARRPAAGVSSPRSRPARGSIDSRRSGRRGPSRKCDPTHRGSTGGMPRCVGRSPSSPCCWGRRPAPRAPST